MRKVHEEFFSNQENLKEKQKRKKSLHKEIKNVGKQIEKDTYKDII